VRRAVIAPDGYLLVTADYSQIEVRVLAELSGDEALRAVFAAGGDVHREAAAAIAGIPPEAVSDELRRSGKAVTFGTVYGAGGRGIAATAWANFGIDLSLEQADAARTAFLDRYPGVRRFQQRQADIGKASGTVRSRLGRPLKSEWEGGRLRFTQSCNHPVQGSAADAVLVAMTRLVELLHANDAHLILQVHDELVVEAAESEAPAVERIMVAVMTEAFAELFPEAPLDGLVKVKTVRVWSDAK
jgi:DNA polymerase-1